MVSVIIFLLLVLSLAVFNSYFPFSYTLGCFIFPLILVWFLPPLCQLVSGVSFSVEMDFWSVAVPAWERSGVFVKVKDERLLFECQSCVWLQEIGQKN